MKSVEMTDYEVEEALKEMTPSGLSGGVLDRLCLAMEEVAIAPDSQEDVLSLPVDHELAALEESLGRLVPHGMPENMIGRLDQAMARWHEKVPVEEKVIPLNRVPGSDRGSTRPGLRAVAAVALMGASAAFLTTEVGQSENMTSQRIPVVNEAVTAPVVFTPGDARESVVSANDHGVLWTEDGLPVRCLEVESRNEVYFLNERGEKLIFTQPKREIMLTPVKFD